MSLKESVSCTLVFSLMRGDSETWHFKSSILKLLAVASTGSLTCGAIFPPSPEREGVSLGPGSVL